MNDADKRLDDQDVPPEDVVDGPGDVTAPDPQPEPESPVAPQPSRGNDLPDPAPDQEKYDGGEIPEV